MAFDFERSLGAIPSYGALTLLFFRELQPELRHRLLIDPPCVVDQLVLGAQSAAAVFRDLCHGAAKASCEMTGPYEV